MANHFSRKSILILTEYNVVLADCNVHLYLVTQRGCATSKWTQ